MSSGTFHKCPRLRKQSLQLRAEETASRFPPERVQVRLPSAVMYHPVPCCVNIARPQREPNTVPTPSHHCREQMFQQGLLRLECRGCLAKIPSIWQYVAVCAAWHVVRSSRVYQNQDQPPSLHQLSRNSSQENRHRTINVPSGTFHECLTFPKSLNWECLYHDLHVFRRSSRNECSSRPMAVGGGSSVPSVCPSVAECFENEEQLLWCHDVVILLMSALYDCPACRTASRRNFGLAREVPDEPNRPILPVLFAPPPLCWRGASR